MGRFDQEIEALFDTLVDIRRRLHQYPELGTELPQTIKTITGVLDQYDIPYEVIENCGILACVGPADGRAIMLRADMDALPIDEATNLAFKSQLENKMHACGHDLHSAMLLGAGILLKRHEDLLNGCVKLLFQPDEEGLGGAKRMIYAKVMEQPKVEAVVGLHVVPGLFLETGDIIGQSGPVMAGSIPFEVEISGKGGHGSAPENAIDPIYAAVQMYQGITSIKMREVSAQEPLVMTIGEFSFGKTCNVIPQSGRISGTIRFFKSEIGEYAVRRVEEIVMSIASALKVEADFKKGVYLPPVINDDQLTQKLLSSIKAEIGEEKVRDYQHKFMSSEDFAFYGALAPAVFLNIGAGSKEVGYEYSLHHPKVLFDENVIRYGVASLVSAAFGFFEA